MLPLKLIYKRDLAFSSTASVVIGKRRFGSVLAGGIVWQHDFDFDPEDALAEQDVTNGSIDVLLRRVTAVNHQPVHEFHSLGSLTTQFSRNDHLAALGTGLHDET